MHIEYKRRQPLGSANNVQRFHKTLQHLSSKKIKQKKSNLFRNLTDDIASGLPVIQAINFVTTSQ